MQKEKLLKSLRTELAFKQIITQDSRMLAVLQQLQNAATQDINVLLVGETGTGKDLCAQAVHFLSPRHNRPFIPLNCGIGPTELFDSILFGHTRGAFTNATSDRPGLIEEANHGFLFLDEVNSLPKPIQVKLNRFLMSGESRRLGENQIRELDVRIIAASNTLLCQEQAGDCFRADMLYRLAEYTIELPPLRERLGDVVCLMDCFLEKYTKKYKKPKLKYRQDIYESARQYHWPGNIRELENMIKRCVIDARNNTITPGDLQFLPTVKPSNGRLNYLSLPWQSAKAMVINDFEEEYLHYHLQQNHGNVNKCARQCGKHRSAFWALLKKYKIDPNKYRK